MNSPTNPSHVAREALLLDQCCAQMESELTRQLRVLDACKEQGRAARAHDIAALDRVTRDLSALVADGLRAEGERQAISARLAAHFQIASADINLSALIARAAEPWRGRLAASRKELKEALAITQRLVQANGRFLRDGARTADRLLAEVFGPAATPEAYDSDGRQPARAETVSAVLNVAG